MAEGGGESLRQGGPEGLRKAGQVGSHHRGPGVKKRGKFQQGMNGNPITGNRRKRR